MKSGITFLLLTGGALLAWSQAPPTSPGVAPTQNAPSPSSDLKARGPEAIAAKDPGRVVATINGKPVTAKEAAELLKLIPEKQRSSAPNLQALFERLYLVTSLADQASKAGLDQQSPWKEQIKLDRDNILSQAYLNGMSSSGSAGGTDPKQYYDSHQDEFNIAKLSGIVIGFNAPGTPASAGGVNRTEQQARDKADDVEKKLKTGADIATLARTESDNQSSAAHGGDLGSISMGSPNLPPDLKSAVFEKLTPGQVSEPIRISNGSSNAFYIVKLDSRTKQTFDQAKPEIMQKQLSDRNQALIKEQVDRYKITSPDPDFFATSTASNIPSLASPSHSATASSSATKPQTQK